MALVYIGCLLAACVAAVGIAANVSAADNVTDKPTNSEQLPDQHLFLPLVAGEESASVQSSQPADLTVESMVATTPTVQAAESEQQAETSAVNKQKLFLAEIGNNPDDTAMLSSGGFPYVDLLLAGGPYVGYNAPAQYALAKEVSIAATGTTYYVDCKNGKDSNRGTSTSTAWKSMDKASAAPLKPGDRMLLKRGCIWTGPLTAGWNGTASAPILIGAYGTGNLPKITDSYMTNVRITGSYLIVEYIHAMMVTPPSPDPHCLNQPVGYKIGFGFSDGASHNILRNTVATDLSIGVSFTDDTHDNQVLYNTITDNNILWKLTSTGSDGATGINLHGNNQEIGRNFFARNAPICTYTGVATGISIELFGATNSNIHHNIASGERIFAELGSSSKLIARNNVFAYNLHVSGYSASTYGARFVVTRGSGSSFGPVYHTKLYNNTVYFTGSGSKAVTCDSCGTDILTLKNNILWASEPFYSSAAFVESHNIFWSSSGSPLLHWRSMKMNAGSKVANPLFIDVARGNFRVQQKSPAPNKADMDTVATRYTLDLDRTALPVYKVTDIGAYEYK
jgi:hypothetical protein